MLIAIGVGAPIALSFLLVLLVRWSRRLSPLNHVERFPSPRRPVCTCYRDDGGPYGLPSVVDGTACLNYYNSHNRWPDWCRFNDLPERGA